MNIALCTDDNYASHCAICITSILENNKHTKCHIYVLTGGLNKENQERFRKLGNIYNQPVDVVVRDTSILDKLQVTNHLGKSMYFRFLLPEIIDDDKVLYLDCDIIIRHCLCVLFETDLTDMACGVVEDQNSDDIRLHNNIMMFSRYFNSGVLLINLEYWRINDISKRLINWILNFKGQLQCPDQDALNVVLENKVKFLDYKYNFQQGLYGKLIWIRADKWPLVEKDKANPAIVHFTAGEKPWHKDCAHPLKHEYDDYMKLYDFLKEEKTNGHRWYFYLVEKIVANLRRIYQCYRIRNGMVVNET